jgi:hypothetical protein
VLTALNLARARSAARPVRWFDVAPACVLLTGVLLFVTSSRYATEAGTGAWFVLVLLFAIVERRRRVLPRQ